MLRALLITAGLIAAPVAAQTGYGRPSSGEYRAEQRATAGLNRDGADEEAFDDDAGTADADQSRRSPGPTPGYDDERAGYARDLAESRRMRADYRRQHAAYRADLTRWRDRVAACEAGVRRACAGYEERYGSYAAGRYAPPPRGQRGYDPDDGRDDGRADDYGDRDDAPVPADDEPYRDR